jgi:maleate cis-trans isomerase
MNRCHLDPATGKTAIEIIDGIHKDLKKTVLSSNTALKMCFTARLTG